MSKPMKVSLEAGSLSQQQATDQKKPCDTCCDLDHLQPVQNSKAKEVRSNRITGNRSIVVSQTLGAYETSAELGCPICRVLVAVSDHFCPGLTRGSETSMILGKDGLPAFSILVSDRPRIILYTKQTLGKCTFSTEHWKSTVWDNRCYQLCPRSSVQMISSSLSGHEHGLPHVAVMPEISPSHSSPGVYDFLRRHLAKCTGEHILYIEVTGFVLNPYTEYI